VQKSTRVAVEDSEFVDETDALIERLEAVAPSARLQTPGSVLQRYAACSMLQRLQRSMRYCATTHCKAAVGRPAAAARALP
jgi:hypothetical protein